MTDTVIVRLRYAVTGSVESAKRHLHQYFMSQQIYSISETFARESDPRDFSAKRFGVDINPDENTGYTNYETFAVAIFLENNHSGDSARPGPYEKARELAKAALGRGTPNDDPNAYSDAHVWLADKLEHLIQQTYLRVDDKEVEIANLPERSRDAGYLSHSLLTAALERVNWMEIADVWITQAKEGRGVRND